MSQALSLWHIIKTKAASLYQHQLQLFLKKDSFQSESYPKLSDAIHHFKNTEEGVNEMCASIETYANDRAMDTAIIACLDFDKTAEEAVSYVEKKFPEIDSDKIISRVMFLWNQKKGE